MGSPAATSITTRSAEASSTRLNGIYKVTPQFSVRGTLGTGFHAPSPGQAHDAILTTNFVAGNQVQTGTYPVDSPISQFYGATALKPEKSTQLWRGRGASSRLRR